MAGWFQKLFGKRRANIGSDAPLGSKPADGGIEGLIEAARTPGDGQASAIAALRRHNDQLEVEAALIEICRNSSDNAVRQKCLDTLELYRPSQRAVDFLAELFTGDTPPNILGKACYTLATCDKVDFPQLVIMAYERTSNREMFLGTICSWLTSSNSGVVFDKLHESLPNDDERRAFVGHIAAKAARTSHWDSGNTWDLLEKFDAELARVTRFALLESHDTKLRSSAAYMLSGQDGPEGLDALWEHLPREADADVQKTIIEQLADAGDVRVVPQLVNALSSSSIRNEEKQNAVYNLGKLDDLRAKQALISAVADPALETEAVGPLLKSKNTAAIQAVLNAAQRHGTRSDRFASQAAAALSSPSTNEGDELLTDLVMFGLRHEYDSVRMETLRPLAASALRVPRIRAAVEAAVHDSYDICRMFANNIMAQAGDPETLKKNVLSAVYRDRTDALEKLSRLDDVAAKEAVTKHRACKEKLRKEVCCEGKTSIDEIARKLLSLSEMERSIIGECVHEFGGHEQMVAIATRYKQLGGNLRLLEGNWDGIGTFRA
jgi:HEAT repeat protein